MDDTQTEQERFWIETYGQEYIHKNNKFDEQLGQKAWRQMLAKTDGIETILECGSNIGRNIGFLEAVLPLAKKSIIELAPFAYEEVTKRYDLEHSFNGSIVDSNLPQQAFDLVFTTSVLIHIHPDRLLENMNKMFSYSRRYVLIAEYFNRTPVMISYQGEENRLFKSDFGQTFISNFPVEIVDYGFLWGYEFDPAGFDDITWWLFEKRSGRESG